MMNKEEKYIEQWNKTIEKGKKIYIIKIALFFGIIATILTPAIEYSINILIENKFIFDNKYIYGIILRFFIFILLGIYLANNSWKRGMKKYEIINNYLENS